MPQRIFVVDDLPDFLELMEDVLSPEGYEIHTFPSVATAVHAAEEIAPDLVITDLRLRGESGFDLLHAFRKQPETRQIPIIVCTAATMDVEEQAEMIPGENVHILYKPFDMSDLLAQVRELLLDSATP